MVLSIKKTFCEDVEGFCKFLKKHIKRVATNPKNWNAGRVEGWDNYLKNLNNIEWPVDECGNRVAATFASIVNSFFSNLDYAEDSDSFMIGCDPSAPLGVTALTVERLARLINYGTTDMPAYSYFSNVFNYFKKNLKYYYGLFAGKI